MSYLQDKKIKKKKISVVVLILILLFSLFFFRTYISKGLSSATHFVFKPVLFVGNNLGSSIKNTRAFFVSKKILLEDNIYLRSQLSENENRMINYNSLLAENLSLKEILNRKENKDMILANILSKPNKSLYDTLIIDAGKNEGIIEGQRVFALGNIPIGRIAEVYGNSSKVILFSNPGERTSIIMSNKNISMEAVGRGGGNFEIILPRDFVIEVGTEVSLPGISSYVLGKIERVLSDPRDSYAKALLSSPINIQEIKFVEVEK